MREQAVPNLTFCRDAKAIAGGAERLRNRIDEPDAAAPKRDVIRRAVSRLLVEACNENGWVIPFPQLTLHRSEPLKD